MNYRILFALLLDTVAATCFAEGAVIRSQVQGLMLIFPFPSSLKMRARPKGEQAGASLRKTGSKPKKSLRIDPDYRTKLDDIKQILGGLANTEGFVSMDQYGPFAVKHRQGLKLVAPEEIPTVPQWQRSKGFLSSPPLELSTNQVTHFYSEKKNTNEVIKLMEILLERNRHLSRPYLSWDSAS